MKGDLFVTMDTKEIHDHLRVQGLIKAYQVIIKEVGSDDQ